MKLGEKQQYLEFEKPLAELESQIIKLEKVAGEKITDEVDALRNQLQELREKIFSNLDPHQILQLARHPNRPYTLDYVKELGQSWIELHGDRSGFDDHAIVGGLLELEPGLTVMLVGTEKGRGIKEKQLRNFGMPNPSGYKKAQRLFKHAERFGFPILTLIDTPGAYPGLEAEAFGQAGVIAQSIQQMSELEVPILAVITGEGGSGGALALAVADRILMLEYAVYSVISPEGCAAILWRTRERTAKAAKSLRITSRQLKELGLIDQIIPESVGGAHHDLQETGLNLKLSIKSQLKALCQIPIADLVAQRQAKFRSFGAFLSD
ncbi:MAG: acetyl-CoA carboxylase carboxyltransferase subunit alpha [Candidatus Caenarcaniphilales bacterium]|nr:acetyl-CoA carboxylase carboxyltransferase subunit alpha [Candidatus Caenarcaniphilales bacterium]